MPSISFLADSDKRFVAGYIRVRAGKTACTVEIIPGILLADYDEAGHLTGIEVLGACSQTDVPDVLPKQKADK